MTRTVCTHTPCFFRFFDRILTPCHVLPTLLSRAGGGFYIQGPDGGENITGDVPGASLLNVRERAALSYHIYQYNLCHGWLHRVPSDRPVFSSLEEYLRWEVEMTMYGLLPPNNPHCLDHLVPLQSQLGNDNWLAQHVHRYPSAKERLLSFVGEVIRQNDRELPETPRRTFIVSNAKESEDSRRNTRLNQALHQRYKGFLLAAGACRSVQDCRELVNEAKTQKLLTMSSPYEYLLLTPTYRGREWYEDNTPLTRN